MNIFKLLFLHFHLDCTDRDGRRATFKRELFISCYRSKVKRLMKESFKPSAYPKKKHFLFLILSKSFFRIYKKINRMFIILLTCIRKTAWPIAANYMRSTWQETNSNLQSLWMKRSSMRMKQIDRLVFDSWYYQWRWQSFVIKSSRKSLKIDKRGVGRFIYQQKGQTFQNTRR